MDDRCETKKYAVLEVRTAVVLRRDGLGYVAARLPKVLQEWGG